MVENSHAIRPRMERQIRVRSEENGDCSSNLRWAIRRDSKSIVRGGLKITSRKTGGCWHGLPRENQNSNDCKEKILGPPPPGSIHTRENGNFLNRRRET